MAWAWQASPGQAVHRTEGKREEKRREYPDGKDGQDRRSLSLAVPFFLVISISYNLLYHSTGNQIPPFSIAFICSSSLSFRETKSTLCVLLPYGVFLAPRSCLFANLSLVGEVGVRERGVARETRGEAVRETGADILEEVGEVRGRSLGR